MARHDEIAANRSHVPAFHSATDPALDANNRVTAGKQWVDITVPSAPVLYIRNEANSAWVAISGSTDFSDSVFRVSDNTTPTKKLAFEVSGVTGTKTLTVPDANTTIVGTDAMQTLTNKTLTAPVISSIVNTGTLTLPTSTDTLVARATSDTLTNKTIDSSTNTVRASSLATTTSPVVVSGATAPTTGQVLTATSATTANWQTPSGGGSVSVYKQTTGGGTTFGDSTTITTPLISIGRVTIPASTTQTVTVNKGGSAASNIYSIMLTTKGNWSNLVYLEDVAGNVFPKVGSTITINNNDTVAHDVYIQAIID